MTECRYHSGGVSWGNNGGSYYIHRVDREGYSRIKEKFEQRQSSTRTRTRRHQLWWRSVWYGGKSHTSFTYFSITFRGTRSVLFWHQTPCFTAVHVLTLTVYISRCKVESTISCHLHGERPQAQCSGIQINIQLYYSNITDIRNKFPYEYLIFSCTYSITSHLYFYLCWYPDSIPYPWWAPSRNEDVQHCTVIIWKFVAVLILFICVPTFLVDSRDFPVSENIYPI